MGTLPPFSFQADKTEGLYRIVVLLPDKRYYLHFYLVDPERPRSRPDGVTQP